MTPAAGWQRRRFLFAAAGLLGGGYLGRGLMRSTPNVSGATPVMLSPGAPFAFLSTDTVPQAGAFSLHVQSLYARSGVATFNGVQHLLLPGGEYLVAIIGAGQPVDDEIEIATGDYAVNVDATDTAGRPFSFSLPMMVTATAFPVDAIDLPPDTSTLLAPATVADELARLATIYKPVTPAALWQGLFRMPVAGPITTHFGEARSYNGGPVSGHHSGVDIGADLGTPAGACASGRVVFAGQLSERGNFVAIDHGLGVFSGYAHLSRIDAVAGSTVAQGDTIGLVGTTGLSTGPHLHWECAVRGIHVDALRWTHVLLP